MFPTRWRCSDTMLTQWECSSPLFQLFLRLNLTLILPWLVNRYTKIKLLGTNRFTDCWESCLLLLLTHLDTELVESSIFLLKAWDMLKISCLCLTVSTNIPLILIQNWSELSISCSSFMLSTKWIVQHHLSDISPAQESISTLPLPWQLEPYMVPSTVEQTKQS